ncbi:hypothetical protein WJX73_007253 [Symbiochloris irregularis]|uniref:HTH TFE/IIEalpha-type domain-containing protein n=1 Tax=Symbiochloris irregularis TaxID=706552 RepID=A0AAW1NR81_9CHLO
MSTPDTQTSAPKRYRDLVHLLARNFYSGECPPAGVEGATAGTKKEPFLDIGIIVLDALARREWVKEDDLAQYIKVSSKHVRRVLRYFETQMLLLREHRKEKVPLQGGADTPTGSTGDQGADGEDAAPVKQVTVSYCCLDYSTILEITQLHLHTMLASLKRQAQDRSAEQLYRCPNPQCRREATTLDAFKLINMADGLFHCDVCDSVMDAASREGAGSSGEHAQQRAKAEKLLVKAEQQLKPLSDLITSLATEAQSTGYVPDFGPLGEWLQLRERAELEASRADVSLALPAAFNSSTPALAQQDTGPPKELPPWLRQAAEDSAAAAQGAPTNGNGSSYDDFREAAAASSIEPAHKKVKVDIKLDPSLTNGGWQNGVGSRGHQPSGQGQWVSVEEPPAAAGISNALDVKDTPPDEDDVEWE